MPWSDISEETKKEYEEFNNRVRFVREHVLQFSTVDQFAQEIASVAPTHKVSAKTLSEVEKAGLPKLNKHGESNGTYKNPISARTQIKVFHALNSLLEKAGKGKISSKTALFEGF